MERLPFSWLQIPWLYLKGSPPTKSWLSYGRGGAQHLISTGDRRAGRYSSHTCSRNFSMTAPSQRVEPYPCRPHSLPPVAAETISPLPPSMPPEHQQERLTLEINMCCWNVFRYHSSRAPLQGKDLPHMLPRAKTAVSVSKYTGAQWGLGNTETSLFWEEENPWLAGHLFLLTVDGGLTFCCQEGRKD